MKPGRREFLSLAGGAIAAPALARAAFGQAQVTLKLHHFLSPVANGHVRLLAPWARKVEADSGHRIRIDIFPSMQLGGAPPGLFDQARDGVADIVWTQPGSTPGRFAAIEVFELPFIAARRALPNARAVQEFSETHAQKELGEVRPLGVFAHDRGLIHATRPVRTMEDLKGLRLRAPTRLAGDALNALGAVGRPIPIPQLPEALAQKAIDGCVIPWEVVPAVKVHELIKFHAEIAATPTLCTATFVLAMNKARYESLPADLKKAIDDNSGRAFAALAGAMWDDQARVVEDLVRKRGNTVTAISAEEAARWRRATEPVTEAWIRQVKDKGLDGGRLIEAARSLIAKHEKAA